MNGLLQILKEYRWVLIFVLHSMDGSKVVSCFSFHIHIQLFTRNFCWLISLQAHPIGQESQATLYQELAISLNESDLECSFKCKIHDLLGMKPSLNDVVKSVTTNGEMSKYSPCVSHIAASNKNIGSVLSQSFELFPNLISLDLPKSSITALTNIEKCLQITHLCLSENSLLEIPEVITALGNQLEVLDFSGNRIQTLPDFITDFSKLRVLLLNDTLIRCLPCGIGKLTMLETLSVESSLIHELPQSFCHLKVYNESSGITIIVRTSICKYRLK